jgi:hypothetical protein
MAFCHFRKAQTSEPVPQNSGPINVKWRPLCDMRV